MKRLMLLTALSLASPLMANHMNAWDNCHQYQQGYNVPLWDNCESHFYAEVDYLAWFANVDGNSYATRVRLDGIDDAGTFTTAGFDSTDLHFCNKWDSGVRAAVGFKPANSSWDIGVVYSYFQTCHNGRAHASVATATTTGIDTGTILGEVIIPSLGVPVAIPSFIGAPGDTESIAYSIDPHFKFYYNAVDLEIGNEFMVARDACIRPFVGFRGLFTEYKSHSTFDTLTTTVIGGSTIDTTETAFLRNHNYFNGFGARTGFDVGYEIFSGFDLYGSLAGSILWGYIESRQFSNVTQDLTTAGAGIGRSSVHSSMLNFDFAFGFRWNWWMNCDTSLLSIRFGWEQHIFTHINHSQAAVSAGTIGGISPFAFPTTLTSDRNIGRGDLTLSGFVVGASYTF